MPISNCRETLTLRPYEVRRSEARLQYEKSFRGPQPALRGEVDMTSQASNCVGWGMKKSRDMGLPVEESV